MNKNKYFTIMYILKLSLIISNFGHATQLRMPYSLNSSMNVQDSEVPEASFTSVFSMDDVKALGPYHADALMEKGSIKNLLKQKEVSLEDFAKSGTYHSHVYHNNEGIRDLIAHNIFSLNEFTKLNVAIISLLKAPLVQKILKEKITIVHKIGILKERTHDSLKDPYQINLSRLKEYVVLELVKSKKMSFDDFTTLVSGQNYHFDFFIHHESLRDLLLEDKLITFEQYRRLKKHHLTFFTENCDAAHCFLKEKDESMLNHFLDFDASQLQVIKDFITRFSRIHLTLSDIIAFTIKHDKEEIKAIFEKPSHDPQLTQEREDRHSLNPKTKRERETHDEAHKHPGMQKRRRLEKSS